MISDLQTRHPGERAWRLYIRSRHPLSLYFGKYKASGGDALRKEQNWSDILQYAPNRAVNLLFIRYVLINSLLQIETNVLMYQLSADQLYIFCSRCKVVIVKQKRLRRANDRHTNTTRQPTYVCSITVYI